MLGEAHELTGRPAQSEANGSLLRNFSIIPCASRGVLFSKKQAATSIAASRAMPPEWFPTSIARPRSGTRSIPTTFTEK